LGDGFGLYGSSKYTASIIYKEIRNPKHEMRKFQAILSRSGFRDIEQLKLELYC
jgi:hypothetical protein